jgi:hypothetical protein
MPSPGVGNAVGRLTPTLQEGPRPQLVGYTRLAGGREGAEEPVSEAVREGASPHPSRRRPVGQTPELHRYRLASRRLLGKMAAAFLGQPSMATSTRGIPSAASSMCSRHSG